MPVTQQPTFVTPVAKGIPAALVKMNGRRQIVPRGGEFPVAEPLFRVVAVGGRRVQIGLITGSFADGTRTLKVRRGHKLTLLDTTSGSRYVIVFVDLTQAPLVSSGATAGTAQPAAATASTAAASTG